MLSEGESVVGKRSKIHKQLQPPENVSQIRLIVRLNRVWKGIFVIRDLTKIRCGNRENDKFIDGIRDLTVPREAGLAKNWARDAGFMFACLSGMPETITTHRF